MRLRGTASRIGERTRVARAGNPDRKIFEKSWCTWRDSNPRRLRKPVLNSVAIGFQPSRIGPIGAVSA